MTVSARSGLPVTYDLLGGLQYCHRVAVFFHSFLEVFLWYYRTLVPCAKGAPKFLEGLLRDCERCTRNYSAYLMVLFLCDEEFIYRLSYLLSIGIYFLDVFPNIL